MGASVTAVAAEACGVADRTGTLEVGKDADLLAVGGNPLEDLAALHNVTAVYVRGRPVPLALRSSPPTVSAPTERAGP
jgi:imidazolonepropionase-like amidohydrolase